MKCSTILLLASTALVAFVKAVPVVENDMAVKTAATMSAGCVMDIPAGGDKTKYNLCPLGGVRKAQTAEEIATECGSLGVYEVPEGFDPTKARKCRDHPLGDIQPGQSAEHSALKNTTPANPLDNSLEKRSCWTSTWYGCKDHYCWSRCGSPISAGYWCWTAVNFGRGAWARCSTDSQCDGKNVSELACGGKCSC